MSYPNNLITICVMTIASLPFTCIESFSQPDSTTAREQSRENIITILHTNDMHGSYMPFMATSGNATAQTNDSGRDTVLTFSRVGWIGGFAVLAGAVKKIRAQQGADQVLLLDGGDTFADDQLSNFTKGELMIRLMNMLDYDMMTLGNHDFDYGLQRTRELSEIATFPMRAANIIEENTGQPIFGDPYVIVEKKGTKIGILSLGYRNTPKTGNPKNVKGLRFMTGREAAARYVPQLREDADIVIILSHEGSSVDKLIAGEVEGIDLIIGAHSHDVITPGRKPYVVQALSDAAVLGELALVISDKKLVDVKETFHWLWHDDWNPDEEVKTQIDNLRQPHLSQLEQKVVEAREIIGRQYKSESPFDKLVGNMLIEAWKCDVSILPGVGYGISLPKGTITSEQIYKLLPHPSKIVTLTMTGEQLKRTLEQSATNLRPENTEDAVGGLIQTAGIKFVIDLRKPVGSRVSNVQIHDKPAEDATEYKVVTHNGLLDGLHRYDEIGKGHNITKTGQSLTEFVIRQLRAKKVISLPANMGEVNIKK